MSVYFVLPSKSDLNPKCGQAIMLVESMDGSRALLGRPRNLRPGVLTCLSGFIEQACRLQPSLEAVKMFYSSQFFVIMQGTLI